MTKKYYVYHHIDPINNDVLYVGHGSGHRAWVFNALVHRQRAHLEALRDLEEQGFLPSDWVQIVVSGLSKTDAKRIEKNQIEIYSPAFNVLKGLGSFADKELVKKAKELKDQGFSVTEVMLSLNFKSRQTAWRYMNAY